MKKQIHHHIREPNLAKGYIKETHRLRSPKKTYNKFIKFAPQFGITRLANITGLDTLQIPTYIACRPNSRALSVSQGKGLTNDAAKVSALMESIESYHSERITLPLKLASYEDLARDHIICNVHSLQKLKRRTFTEHARIHWIEAYDLINDSYKWVPYELVHTDYRSNHIGDHGYFPASSNGLASGNHRIEAAIHAACEVIERDSAVSWFSQGKERRIKTKINPLSITDKDCQKILKKFEAANIHYGIWDMTGPTGIPCFICRILPADPPPASSIRPAEGMGCHLSKNIALLRALTEAAQSRLTFISGARDDLSRAEYQHFLKLGVYKKWQEEIYAKNFLDYQFIKNYETQSFSEDLERIIKKLKNAGFDELLITDLTKADFDIPVVRVIIPGTNSEFNPANSEMTCPVKKFHFTQESINA